MDFFGPSPFKGTRYDRDCRRSMLGFGVTVQKMIRNHVAFLLPVLGIFCV